MAEYTKKVKQTISQIINHPLYKKYSLIVIPLFCSLLAILILVLVTVPQIYKLIEKNQELELLKEKKVLYQEKSAALNKIDLDFYKRSLNNSLYSLPSEKDIPSAINSILDVISYSGLQMTNLSLGSNTVSVSGVESFNVNIEVNGSLDQIKSLIDAQSKSVRLLKIVGISITNSATANLQGSIDILVFHTPLETSTKIALDQKLAPLTDEETKLINQLEQTVNLNMGTVINQTEGPIGKDDPFN